MFSFSRVLAVGVLLLLVWLPLPLGSNREWAAGLAILATGLLACGWCAAHLLGRLSPSPALRSALPMVVALLLVQVWVATQWLAGWSQDNGATQLNLWLGCSYALLFILLLSLFHTRRRLSLLLGTLVFSGMLQGFYGAFMTLSGVEWLLATPKTTYIGDATGTFVNRNSLAGYLEMTLAAGIGLLMALRDQRAFRWAHLIEALLGPKARLRLALVIMVIALVMTHSRGGNASFFSALLLVGGIFVLRDRTNRLRNSLILLSILLIDVLVISQYFGLEKLKDRVLNTRLTDVVVDGEVVQRANELRGEVFLDALPLALDKPLTGQGAGSFEAVFPAWVGDDIRLHFDLAHNDYLQFFIEYGVPGFVLLLIFVLMALGYGLRTLWRNESIYRSGVALGAVMGIVSIGFHSFTDFNLQMPANAATFVTLCAIAVLAAKHSSPRQKARSSFS